jgi:branched-chain amino acid transport system permease protein
MNGRNFALGVAFVALITLPFWLPGTYYINVSSQILFYAIFALGLNILVGYGGLVSLGHAGLFGIAAYATGYLLQSGWTHTPAILVALVIGLASTAVFAALALRATGIGFIMITLALGQIVWGLAYRWISLTGGDNGINLHGRPRPFGLDLGTAPAFYYATLLIFLISVVAVAIFVRSPFGAALVVIVKNVVSGYIERWNFLLGTIFVAIVILMPEGLVPGTVRLWRSGLRSFRRRSIVLAQSAEPKP